MPRCDAVVHSRRPPVTHLHDMQAGSRQLPTQAFARRRADRRHDVGHVARCRERAARRGQRSIRGTRSPNWVADDSGGNRKAVRHRRGDQRGRTCAAQPAAALRRNVCVSLEQGGNHHRGDDGHCRHPQVDRSVEPPIEHRGTGLRKRRRRSAVRTNALNLRRDRRLKVSRSTLGAA